MEYYSATRKKIPPLVKTWMNLEDITLSEISQTEKYKKCVISLIYGILKKMNSYKQLWHAGSSSLMRDRTQAPCIGSAVLATGPPWNSPDFQF